MGDFLGRLNYSCGGPNPQSASKPGYRRLIRSVPQQCDSTKIEVTTCNPRFVADSSDYIRFKKLRAMNQTYNDVSL
jgi:NADP-dependent 3-hydroxy acid dehydrogenase YdfG